MSDIKKFIVKFLIFTVLLLMVDHFASLLIKHGLEKYYGLDQHAKIVVNGASQTMLALDKNRIEEETGWSVAKYTFEGVSVKDRYVMVSHFFRNKPDSLKIVIFGVDEFLFTAEGLSKNSYALFYPFLDDPEISEYVRKSCPNWYVYYIHKYIKCSRYEIQLINSSIRGYMGDWSNRKTGTVNMVNLSNLIRGKHERKIKNNPDYVNAFAATMKLLQEKNIKVILLYLPYVDLLEFNDPKRDATREIIRQYAGLNPNVYFLDYTQPLSDQHQWYFDPNHLNPMGQAAATELLIKDIKALRESNNK